MKRTRFPGGGVPPGMLLVAILAGLAALSGQEEAGPITRLDLGFDTEQPGHAVVVPLSLDLPAGIEVGKAVSRITFPSRLLSFEGAAPGLSAQASAALVSAVAEPDDRDPGNTVLTVTVSSAPGGTIPSGMLADLSFTISEDAPAEVTIRLSNRAAAFTSDDPPRPIEPLAGREGEVAVRESPPVFACFFYMH